MYPRFSLILLLPAAIATCHAQPDRTLTITRAAPVTSDILALTIETGKGEHARQVAYVPVPGDKVEVQNGKDVWLKRRGKVIGALVGPERKLLYGFDRVTGPRLDTEWADQQESYRLQSDEDPAYAAGLTPLSVFRKSKPIDMFRTGKWNYDWSVRHTLYLHLPHPLKEGATYGLSFPRGAVAPTTYRHSPRTTRSEAVHISQLGFRPDDPAKVAFLSCWLGSGGGAKYPPGMKFEVLDDADGEAVFSGKTVLSKAADDATEDPYKRNYNGADVYLLDFTPLNKPGQYRVYVEGVGCSYPFEIASDVWTKAFRVSARGFYHQRSGIALGPPYTNYRRPRCFHPDDGLQVFASTCPLMDSRNGLNARGTDKDNFGNLVRGKTDEIVPNAWGGYCDAGDWDRRIQHLRIARLLLELAERYPAFVESTTLDIPESDNDLPDVLDEALWGLDFFRRLQQPDGGVRGGIESAEHPRYGEASWQESLTVMAYAPGMWSSYLYAAEAAHAARVLRARRPQLAATYRDSALRAMEWAEKRIEHHDYDKLPHAVPDARNLAAVELLRLTGEQRWHTVFLETTAFTDPEADLFVWQHHDQREAAFAYVAADLPERDEQVLTNARNALLREADDCVKWVGRTGFRWTKLHPWIPLGWGAPATPQALSMLRVYALTGEAKYLRATVLTSQFGAGANPTNLCFTTGVGREFPHHPLVVDQHITGQAPPPGITVYGPLDMQKNANHWMVKLFTPVTYPPPKQWPALESYFDLFMLPPSTEFTVMQTMAPNAYVWGCLAARP